MKVLLLSVILNSTICAQVLFSINSEISLSSWKIPVLVETKLSESIAVKYSGQLFDRDHPDEHYIWYSYTRDLGITYVNTESYVSFNKDAFSAVFGRKYFPVGHGKMSGLFISPIAPSLDQMTFTLNNFHGINYRHTIIRLDNRFNEEGGVKNVVNRWYYLNQVGYNYKDVFEINFFDAVIATGYNRGIEWYYANPLSSLFMERKHQIHRDEGQNSTTAVGIGDNDNHFVGGDLHIKFNNFSFYGEWLIDEWQLSSEHRDNMQTVFGIMTGLGYMRENWAINLEYSIASPWLYINRALYGSLEQHEQPLGLRNPQSQSLNVGIDYNIDNSRVMSVFAHVEQRGAQELTTPWDAWDNKKGLFDFTRSLPAEYKIIYHDPKSRYWQRIGVFHNWFQSSSTYLILGWNLDFNL